MKDYVEDFTTDFCDKYTDCRGCPMFDELADMCCFDSAALGIGMYEDPGDYDY